MYLPFIISLLAGLSTIVGSLLIFINIDNKNINKFITFCLSFSISIMINTSIFDLLPTSFTTILNTYNLFITFLLIIISFIISYFIITYLNNLIKNTLKEDLYRLGILNMLILMIHNFPEGIATFLSSYHSINLGIKLGIAISLHNIPEGISIAVPIYYATKSKRKAILATFISGFIEPLGAILAFIFLKNYVNDLTISFILIIVAGLMIVVSIEEMLPKALEYKEYKIIYLGLFLGILVVLASLVLL